MSTAIATADELRQGVEAGPGPGPATPPDPSFGKAARRLRAKLHPEEGNGTAPGTLLVKIGNVSPDPKQPRKHFEQNDLAELAESIKAHGLLQPLVVRPCGFAGIIPANHKFLIVVGERRWRAAKLAGLNEIKCEVRAIGDLEALECQIVENEQRADMTPLEKAEGYARLLAEYEKGSDLSRPSPQKPMARLCKRIGKSESTIYDLLKLRQLPEPARKAVQKGELDKTTANLIARLPTAKEREKAAKTVINGKMSFRAAKATIKKAKPDPARSGNSTPPQAPAVETPPDHPANGQTIHQFLLVKLSHVAGRMLDEALQVDDGEALLAKQALRLKEISKAVAHARLLTGLRRALHCTEGAAGRWAKLRARGASDSELRERIGKEMGQGGQAGPGLTPIAYKGGKDPQFWWNKSVPTGEPTLRGLLLVADARRAMGVPIR